MKSLCRLVFWLVAIMSFPSSCKHPAEESVPLPNIDIVSESIPWDHKIPCVIVYSHGDTILTEKGNVKCRGGYSSGFAKHSFSLKMNDKQSFSGLPLQRSYILNANYIDKTLMRHKLCFDLFREMSHQRNIASRCAYVTVSNNGHYSGIYVLMQKLNAGSLGLDKRDSLAMIFKDPPVFYGENRMEWVQEPGNYFQQNFPDIEDEDRNGYLEDIMQFMIHASDSAFAQEIGLLFDLENIIDWHLLLMFTNNGDGVMKNFYLYKRDSHTPFRIAIWDYDDSFGRDGTGELKITESLPDFDRCLLLNRLQNNPNLDYEARLRARYKELRDCGIFSKKHIEQMMDENDKTIRREVQRNFERWPADGPGYHDTCGYEEELEIMRRYLDIRIPQIDKELGYSVF